MLGTGAIKMPNSIIIYSNKLLISSINLEFVGPSELLTLLTYALLLGYRCSRWPCVLY